MDRSGLKPHPPPLGVCAAGVMRGRAPNCSPGHAFQQHRAFLLMSPVWLRCSRQGLAVAAALGESKPEPQSPGPPSRMGCPGWRGRGQGVGWEWWGEGTGGTGPGRRLELLAEQGPLVASRGWCCLMFGPAEALRTSLGALEAGFGVLSFSGDQEPLDQPPRAERQQRSPAGTQGCPRVMLPVAPRKAGPH